MADPLASGVERHPPVDADDVGADRTDLGQELTGGDAEVDLRYAGVGDGVHHFLAVREDIALILRRAQGPGPGIEELNRRCAVVDLALQGADGDVGEAIAEGVPQSFVGEHHRLGVCVVARRPAFDEIRGDGEGRAGEADQRAIELSHELSYRFEYVGRVGLGIERPKTGEVVLMAERPFDFGTDARCDGEPETDGVGRHDDVGVEDRSVDVVATDRLQRDLGGEIGVGNGVEDRSGAANGAVLGQRAARLAHEPDRHPVVGQPATGLDEGVVVVAPRRGGS